MGNLITPAHAELVAFAQRIARNGEELAENTFGVKYLAELWMQAGIELQEASK